MSRWQLYFYSKLSERDMPLYSVGPYDFYETTNTTYTGYAPRLFLLNQVFTNKPLTRFNKKFESGRVMEGHRAFR